MLVLLRLLCRRFVTKSKEYGVLIEESGPDNKRDYVQVHSRFSHNGKGIRE